MHGPRVGATGEDTVLTEEAQLTVLTD